LSNQSRKTSKFSSHIGEFIETESINQFTLFSSDCRHFIPNKEERRAALLKCYMFECYCPACVNDYPPGTSMLQKDPLFKSSLNPKSSGKSKIDQASNYITKNFQFHPSQELFMCEQQIKRVISEVCWLHDWPLY
jgi:hypothetical protein